MSEIMSHRASRPQEAPGECPSCLFQLLGIPAVSGLVDTSLQPLPLSSPIYSPLCPPPLIRILVVGFRAYVDDPRMNSSQNP